MIPRQKRAGYVYAIHSHGPFYKIGCSFDVNQRLATLQTGNPLKLRIVGTFKVDDVYSLEEKIHKLLDDRRINGEWFAMDDDSWAIFAREVGDFDKFNKAYEKKTGKSYSETEESF